MPTTRTTKAKKAPKKTTAKKATASKKTTTRKTTRKTTKRTAPKATAQKQTMCVSCNGSDALHWTAVAAVTIATAGMMFYGSQSFPGAADTTTLLPTTPVSSTPLLTEPTATPLEYHTGISGKVLKKEGNSLFIETMSSFSGEQSSNYEVRITNDTQIIDNKALSSQNNKKYVPFEGSLSEIEEGMIITATTNHNLEQVYRFEALQISYTSENVLR